MRFLSVSWQVSANGEYSSDISVGKSELRILEKFRVNSWLNFLAEVYFICWREYAEDCLLMQTPYSVCIELTQNQLRPAAVMKKKMIEFYRNSATNFQRDSFFHSARNCSRSI